MIRKTMLSLLAVLAVGLILVPAYAASSGSPLDQYQSGVPLSMIQCPDGMVLLKSPSDKPMCLTAGSSNVLADRGYSLVIYTEEETMLENYTSSNSMIKDDPTNAGEFVPNIEAGNYESTVEKIPQTNIITASSLPITTNTEFLFQEELDRSHKKLLTQRGPAEDPYSELYPVFTDLQGVSGDSEITLPFTANQTKIGYLPDGMVVKFILHRWDPPPGSQYWQPIPPECDSFSYYIFPQVVDVKVLELTNYWLDANGAIIIGMGRCTYESWPENAKPFFKSFEEGVEWRMNKAAAMGVEVRERVYLDVPYFMTGKYDGNGAIADWQQDGLMYDVRSENYSMDEIEKIVKGMIE